MDKQLIEKQLLYCPVAWQAKHNPQQIALQTDKQRINFGELHLQVENVAQQLKALSMKKADRLACIATNSVSLVLLQLACLRCGFIFCPINAKFNEAEINQRLAVLKTPFIWHQDNEKNHFVLNFDLELADTANHSEVKFETFSIEKFNAISIIFTSGSSGAPKAVMHHFSNHYYSALGSQSVIPLNVGDKNLLSLPIFHISGYATVMRTILAGATLQILNTKINSQLLQQQQITHLSLVCSQLIQLLEDPLFEKDLLSIKHLLLGGSSFPRKCLQQTRERGFTYHLSYGSTEMASQIATSTNNESLTLLPYRKMKLLNNEIMLAGKTRFIGYFQQQSIENDAYFASSDLGEINAKEIKIIGRKDRQFISGGENIQPEEIEKVLLTYPGLSQTYVLPIEDSLFGQRPIAFIKWEAEERPEQLKQFISTKLISFKRPLHYFTMPAQQGIKVNQKQLTELACQLLK